MKMCIKTKIFSIDWNMTVLVHSLSLNCPPVQVPHPITPRDTPQPIKQRLTVPNSVDRDSGLMFLMVPAYPGSPGQRAVKWLCVLVVVLLGHIAATAVVGLAWRLPSTYLTLGCREIPVLPKTSVYFPLEFCPKFCTRKFCHDKSSCYSRACWPMTTLMTVDVSWLDTYTVCHEKGSPTFLAITWICVIRF